MCANFASQVWIDHLDLCLLTLTLPSACWTASPDSIIWVKISAAALLLADSTFVFSSSFASQSNWNFRCSLWSSLSSSCICDDSISSFVRRRLEPTFRRWTALPFDYRYRTSWSRHELMFHKEFTTYGTDILRRVEGLENFWVKLQKKVLLFCNCLIPAGYRFVDPISKSLTDDGVADVDKPLARHLHYITLVRQILRDSWVLTCKLENILSRKSFVVWAREKHDIVAFEEKFSLGTEVYGVKVNQER